jgi:hypothetical protein
MVPTPEAAAYGFLLHSYAEEAAHLAAELDHRQRHGLAIGYLQQNLEAIRSTHERIAVIATEHHHNPPELERRFGKINFREAYRTLGIEKAYLVDYAYASGFVHEGHLAKDDFTVDTSDERGHELGPVTEDPGALLVDSIRYTAVGLNQASLVIRDDLLAQESSRFVDEFMAVHDERQR